MKLGFHIDLRVQIMPMEYLKHLAGQLREMGYDTLLIEWEGTFPFRKHAIVSNSLSYSLKEIETFLSHCRALAIDVIPLQQCFGHVEYILQHHRYKHLRENERDVSQICPCRDGEALEVFCEIFSEIIEVHSSPYIHIGGDETQLLGSCPSCKAAVRRYGKSRLYVDYAKKAAEVVLSLGKRPIIWADMLLKYPKEAEGMPAETVFLDWRYGEIASNETVPKQFSRFEIWGSPAIRCHPDDHSFTDWKNHFANLETFVPFARKFNHQALIVTSWSTSGRYDLKWGSNYQVLDMQPSRRVYPLPGFRLLQEGFVNAVNLPGSYSSKAFIEGYFEVRFGIHSKRSSQLYDGLIANSGGVGPDTPLAEIKAALKIAKKIKSLFDQTLPTQNKAEWQHLVLQTSLRAFDLQVRMIEALSQSGTCSAGTLLSLGRRVRSLLPVADDLRKRFLHLNKTVLLPIEMQADISYRDERLMNLHRRLNKVRS